MFCHPRLFWVLLSVPLGSLRMLTSSKYLEWEVRRLALPPGVPGMSLMWSRCMGQAQAHTPVR